VESILRHIIFYMALAAMATNFQADVAISWNEGSFSPFLDTCIRVLDLIDINE
jgi:hypothetical protein